MTYSRFIGISPPFSAGYAAAANLANTRLDPYANYNFLIEIEGLLTGGFASVRGLESEIEVEEYREGGVNGYIHKLPVR